MIDSIFGIKPSTIKPEALENNFIERYFESDNAFFETKETFHHEEDGLVFDYKYIIEAVWCDGSIFYGLYLVPDAKSLAPEKLTSVAKCSGIEEDEVDYYDIFSYGINILVGNYEDKDCEDIKEDIINLIANIYTFVDGMFGFYMDKIQNRIGTSGWDMLNDYINGINFMDATRKRWNF